LPLVRHGLFFMILSEHELVSRLEHTRQEAAQAAQGCGRNPEEITLVAVSKLHPAKAVAVLADAGHRDFGENYIQEALGKQEELSGRDIRWHFIGHLQSNKAKFAAGRFALIHTLDSAKLARALHNRAQDMNIRQDVLIQVNVSGEEQKFGVSQDGLGELAEAVAGFSGLALKGLMSMPPFFDRPEAARPYFARLRELRDKAESDLGVRLPHLSMGMTGDFPVAIQEGATIIRIGTKIFGPRPAKQRG